MYNLVVSGNNTGRDLPAYEFPNRRYFEYTSDTLRSSHSPFTVKVLADLKSYPSLFLYEQYEKFA